MLTLANNCSKSKTLRELLRSYDVIINVSESLLLLLLLLFSKRTSNTGHPPNLSIILINGFAPLRSNSVTFIQL
ncbi:hypothetical protein DERP_008818 [Dermatophagoides pteronyssinus]|uniref:Uncharacterized protein n=1 Tax=Dermatophagoides pteronyssinus TaxID=6956 RepID=A0ABQ8IWD9_DERPT|nr:hypothetical protein DERP_008818 [Dermatophagoides pteronyssinus]